LQQKLLGQMPMVNMRPRQSIPLEEWGTLLPPVHCASWYHLFQTA
jgi:hypothetical protein